MSTDDLLSMEIDDGTELNIDYDEQEESQPQSEPKIVLGYGKDTVLASALKITSTNAFVPNATTYTDKEGKQYQAGYFSFSALSTYRRCQRLFKYRYVDKLRFKQPAPKMWGGNAIHDTFETMLQAKIDDPDFKKAIRDSLVHEIAKKTGDGLGKFVLESIKGIYNKPLPFTNESIKQVYHESFGQFTQAYDEAQERAKENNQPLLPEINWGARVESPEQFHVMYLNAIDAYLSKEYALTDPQSVEDTIVYHFPLDSGGTVPIVGFVDLIEKADFMAEYHNDVYRTDADNLGGDVLKNHALKTIKSIDNGAPIITDHKTGLGKTYEQARTDEQLTLYSMAKNIPTVAFNSVKLGTTGGKRPDRAKPPQIKKVFGQRTQQDYDNLTQDFNSIIKGISSGIFDKSGSSNSMVCSPTLCPGYERCFGKPK